MQLVDLAPTILHLSGLPVPDDMDGRVLGDLFTNRNPPLDLLKLSQKFFKHRLALEPHDSIHQKVSYLFYLMSIVAARVRCGVNISKLTNQQQLQTINSIVKQPWVQDQIRELLAEGRRQISSELGR